MDIKKHIPNLLTLSNLFCGTIAVIFTIKGHFELTAALVTLGIVFDFFDGFLARTLKVSGELGKQLDSLADMVTSGVVPGLVMFSLFSKGELLHLDNSEMFNWVSCNIQPIQFTGLLLTLTACYRLAKFNIDSRQSNSFIGLPTPAMSLFVISLPLIQIHTEGNFIRELIANNYFLIGITLLLSYLMNAELRLFSLKFKNFGFKENFLKYLLIGISIILLLSVQYLAIPIIISIYIILSLINNITTSKQI